MTTNAATSSHKSYTLGKILALILFVILAIWALIELFPIYYLFLNSVKSNSEIVNTPYALPQHFMFSNYIEAWAGGDLGVPIGRYFFNSLFVTIGTTVILMFTGSLAGYSLARYKFPGVGLALTILLWSLAIPVHAALIPVFLFLGELGMRNNYFGLMGVYAAFWMPFTIIVMKAYFESFPHELEDAAKIDGCSEFSAFIRVVLPVSKGALVSVTILNVIGIWSELLFAFILMNKSEMRTLPVGILAFRGQYQTDWSLIFAGLAIATIPTMVFYFLFQRQITKGMTMGALK